MTSINTVIYCSGEMGPDNGQTLNIGKNGSAVQSSGVTTVVLWALHIGRPNDSGQQLGDLIFNNSPYTLVSRGMYNSAPFGTYPVQVAQLKQGGGVSKIFFSVGGANPPVWDFTTIAYIITTYGTGPTSPLYQNFLALRNAFTINGVCVIDGIDLDCEEAVDPSVIVQFSQMLFGLGFEVTFCPFTNATAFWQPAMQELWSGGNKVSWWNLQCYAGGNGNDVQSWISAIAGVTGASAAPSYLVPGLAVAGSEWDGQNPATMETTFAGWKSTGITGGFLWDNGAILANETNGSPALADYVKAINNGLTGS